MLSCEEGIFFFKEGKKDKNNKTRFILHTWEGKVVIGEGCEEPGYYTYKSLEEKPKCVVARGLERINYDYYSDMGYDEFKELILLRGYSISFEMPFEWKSPLDDELHNEMRLVAFNKKYNMVIIADSIFDRSAFNSVECYCYGVIADPRASLFPMGSDGYSVFDLEYAKSYMEPSLRLVERVSCKDENVFIDPQDDPPGFTYVDNPDSLEEFSVYREKFYNLCSPELRDYLYKK